MGVLTEYRLRAQVYYGNQGLSINFMLKTNTIFKFLWAICFWIHGQIGLNIATYSIGIVLGCYLIVLLKMCKIGQSTQQPKSTIVNMKEQAG
jgi:hypothetical protein